jgi:transposase InsO family protein
MKELAKEYSIAPLAETLEVSKSGFYADQRKLQGRRSQEDQQLLGRIEKLFLQSRRTYGSPRLCAALRAQGWVCGKNRVARLMRLGGLRARQKRAFRPTTTLSQHPLALARNWLAKVPAPDRPNQVWQSDITYLPTAQGWLYLAVTLDASSRKVVGWATSESLHTTLVTEALKRAWQTRRPSPGLLHHSDRGFQYANHRFRRLLQSFGATASMSRKANCYDNALVESFFSTLKTECFDQPLPATKQQTRLLLFDYIEGFYNPRRLHSALGYLSPLPFENRFL